MDDFSIAMTTPSGKDENKSAFSSALSSLSSLRVSIRLLEAVQLVNKLFLSRWSRWNFSRPSTFPAIQIHFGSQFRKHGVGLRLETLDPIRVSHYKDRTHINLLLYQL